MKNNNFKYMLFFLLFFIILSSLFYVSFANDGNNNVKCVKQQNGVINCGSFLISNGIFIHSPRYDLNVAYNDFIHSNYYKSLSSIQKIELLNNLYTSESYKSIKDSVGNELESIINNLDYNNLKELYNGGNKNSFLNKLKSEGVSLEGIDNKIRLVNGSFDDEIADMNYFCGDQHFDKNLCERNTNKLQQQGFYTLPYSWQSLELVKVAKKGLKSSGKAVNYDTLVKEVGKYSSHLCNGFLNSVMCFFKGDKEDPKQVIEAAANEVVDESLANCKSELPAVCNLQALDKVNQEICGGSKDCENKLKNDWNIQKNLYAESTKVSDFLKAGEEVMYNEENFDYALKGYCDMGLNFACTSRFSFYEGNPWLQKIFGQPIANSLCYNFISGISDYSGSPYKEKNGVTYATVCNKDGCTVDAVSDLRGERTPINPDNTTFITISYFYKIHSNPENFNKKGKDYKVGIIIRYKSKSGYPFYFVFKNISSYSLSGNHSEYPTTATKLLTPYMLGDDISGENTVLLKLNTSKGPIDKSSFEAVLFVFDANGLTSSNLESHKIFEDIAPITLIRTGTDLKLFNKDGSIANDNSVPSDVSPSVTNPAKAKEDINDALIKFEATH